MEYVIYKFEKILKGLIQTLNCGIIMDKSFRCHTFIGIGNNKFVTHIWIFWPSICDKWKIEDRIKQIECADYNNDHQGLSSIGWIGCDNDR